jgi:hypothetical protein
MEFVRKIRNGSEKINLVNYQEVRDTVITDLNENLKLYLTIDLYYLFANDDLFITNCVTTIISVYER